MRSAAQMVSYEVSIGLILINILLCAGTLNLTQIVLAQQNMWYIIPLFPIFIMFYISILAETNRAPFDLPEAEAELVAGYNVEYSAMGFALFFLGEYANMILMCSLTTIFFFWWLITLSQYASFLLDSTRTLIWFKNNFTFIWFYLSACSISAI